MPTLFPVMRICAAAFTDVAYVSAAGALLNRLWIGRLSTGDKKLRACLRTASVALLLLLPVQFFLLSASMVGDTSWTDAWQAMPDVASTHSGRALLISWCLLPCLLLLSFLFSSLSRIKGTMLGIGLVVCFLAFRSINGHAASDGDFTLREAMQFLHLCSIATWSGGIIIAGLITAPCLASANHFDDLALYGRRLSQTITVALAIVIATGIYNSWKGLGGSLTPLPHTAWGRMLLLKLSFVLLALGHGARVRFLLKAPLPWTDRQATIMRRWLRTEAMLMTAVVVCSAWLAKLPPADM